VNRRGFIVAAAVAVATARPAGALAASDEGGLLLGLWRREAGAAHAYQSVLYTDAQLVHFGMQEVDHARAIATQLAAVGLDTPVGPASVADLDIAAQRLANAGTKRAEVLAAAIALEEGLVALYQQAIPALPDPKIAMTAATILASHAQHLFILRSSARVP
jgi:hypothetical protein